MQATTTKLWMEVGDSYERIRRILAPKGIGTSLENQQNQLTWTLGVSQRLNHQPKNMSWLNLGLAALIADVQFCLHMGPEQLEQGLSQKLLPVCSSSWAVLSGLSVRGCAYPADTCCARVGGYPGEPPPFQRRRELL